MRARTIDNTVMFWLCSIPFCDRTEMLPMQHDEMLQCDTPFQPGQSVLCEHGRAVVGARSLAGRIAAAASTRRAAPTTGGPAFSLHLQDGPAPDPPPGQPRARLPRFRGPARPCGGRSRLVEAELGRGQAELAGSDDLCVCHL